MAPLSLLDCVAASAARELEGCPVLIIVVVGADLDGGICLLIGILVLVGRIGLGEKGCVRIRKRWSIGADVSKMSNKMQILIT